MSKNHNQSSSIYWISYIATGISQIILVTIVKLGLTKFKVKTTITNAEIQDFFQDLSTTKIIFIVLPIVLMCLAILLRYITVNKPYKALKKSAKANDLQSLFTFHLLTMGVAEGAVILLFVSTILLKSIALLITMSPFIIFVYFIFHRPPFAFNLSSTK